MGGISVLVAEDHDLVRAGLSSLVNAMAGIRVVGEAANGKESVAAARALAPDVVLMDISMPEESGLDAAASIAAEMPGSRVIMLTMHDGESFVWQALRAGVSGYLLKTAAPGELETAIRSVAGGGAYLTPEVSQIVLSDFARRDDRDARPRGLTPRQLEILRLIATGHTNQEMATILGVRVKTVESHRALLMSRLDIHDVAGLVRYAVRLGLVSTDA